MATRYDAVSANDLEALIAFARLAEQRALAAYPALPTPDSSALIETLSARLERPQGIVAREHGDLVGALLPLGPWSDYHGGASGIYVPLASCLVADGVDPDRVFTTMLSELGRLESLAGVDAMAITFFTNQQDLLQSAALNGFGIRCADAVARIDDLPTPDPHFPLEIRIVPWQDAVAIIEPKRALAAHLHGSPSYMEYFDFTPEFIAWKSQQRESVHLVAMDGEHMVGFIEATYEGENYLTVHPTMRNICGAAVLPEYRNRGIMRQLVAALADHYRGEGVIVLGVDYETLNPTARGFWERLFTVYTRSPERRFDVPWHAQ